MPRAPKRAELIFGINPIREALAAGRRRFEEIQIARRRDDPETADLLEAAQAAGARVVYVERRDLDRRIPEGGHQGIAARVSPFEYAELDDLIAPVEGRRRLLAADGIQDPRNLGAMIRTVEAAGFQGAVLHRHQAAGITPVAVKASAGAAEHLPVALVTNLATALTRLKDKGFWIVGLDAAGDSIYEVDLDRDLVLVVGSEGTGIRRRVATLCDLRVSLPLRGKSASLNASAAVAAAVFQVMRSP